MRQKQNKTKRNSILIQYLGCISAVLNNNNKMFSKETTTKTTLLTLKVKLLIIIVNYFAGEKGKFKLTHRTDPDDQVFPKDA